MTGSDWSQGGGPFENMIDLICGIRCRYRFRDMGIYSAEEMQLLLDACTKTLETLGLEQTDPRGEQPSLKRVRVLANNFVASSSLRDFDLSWNKSLRTLEVRVRYLHGMGFLKYTPSTITPPVFSKITVIYRDFDLPWSRLQAKAAEDALSHRRRSEVFRAMRRVRDFQLVLCARVRDDVGGYSVQKLKQVVAEEKVKMGRDHISPEPLVVCGPSEPRNRVDRQFFFSL